ncbi:hypothetical protein [Nonomuraea aurantiaca]|jgi:hypothetical protein|uniref:hypothetical protein n=1 Tax=Nonomuraea aurantiaca TaxID=2878562 RepID=UPI001CD96ABF|nr:hypothetical protein [Nonomuraea aurantiaca]MCA2229276.1 hypothetical protein [Nonomuraea aurantiaca]
MRRSTALARSSRPPDRADELLAEINDVGLGHYRRIMHHLDIETLRRLLQVTARVREVADQLHP